MSLNLRQDDISFILVLTAAVGVTGFSFSAGNGSEGIYYAAMPLLAFLLFSSVFAQGAENFLAVQFAQRVRKGKITDAILFFKSALVCGALAGLVAVLAGVLLGRLLGVFLWSNGNTALAMYTLAPGCLFMGLLGPCLGILKSAGRKNLLQILYTAFLIACVVLGCIFGRMFSYRGEKIALLLRNDTYAAVYGGAGIGIGVSLAALLALIAAAVLIAPILGSFRSREDRMEIDHDEEMRDIVPYCFRKLVPYFPVGLLPLGFFLVDMRIAQAFLPSGAEASKSFGSILGIAGAYAFGMAGLILFRMIGVIKLPLRSFQKRHKAFREQYSMIYEIPAFVAAPAALFMPAAAHSILQMTKSGLEQHPRESALAALRFGFPFLFFLVFAVLALVFTWRAGFKNAVYSALTIAGIGQIAVLYICSSFFTGEYALFPALDAFAVLAFCLCILMTRRGLLGSADSYYLQIWWRALGASLIAAIPVGFLDGYIASEIIPVGGVVLLLMLFLIIYLPLSIMMGALNPSDLEWMWFSRSLRRLMQRLGRGGEDR